MLSNVAATVAVIAFQTLAGIGARRAQRVQRTPATHAEKPPRA